MGDALQGKFAGRPPLRGAEASENYHIVLEQICHAEEFRTLKKSGADVSEAASQVADAVVELQIKGRPGGRCSLCPSRGGV